LVSLVTPRVGHQTIDPSIAIRPASEGMGIAVVSELSVSTDVPALIAIPFEVRHRLEHMLVHRNRRLPPALERLIAAVLQPSRAPALNASHLVHSESELCSSRLPRGESATSNAARQRSD
jgi:DNA-binding transcriptional LysR family regulator